jgi:hypothetical protein
MNKNVPYDIDFLKKKKRELLEKKKRDNKKKRDFKKNSGNFYKPNSMKKNNNNNGKYTGLGNKKNYNKYNYNNKTNNNINKTVYYNASKIIKIIEETNPELDNLDLFNEFKWSEFI